MLNVLYVTNIPGNNANTESNIYILYIYIYIFIRTLQPSCGKVHWHKYREVGSWSSGQLRSGQF